MWLEWFFNYANLFGYFSKIKTVHFFRVEDGTSFLIPPIKKQNHVRGIVFMWPTKFERVFFPGGTFTLHLGKVFSSFTGLRNVCCF